MHPTGDDGLMNTPASDTAQPKPAVNTLAAGDAHSKISPSMTCHWPAIFQSLELIMLESDYISWSSL